MHIRARYTKHGGHYYIRVFTATSPEYTHANSGELIMREDELDAFKEQAENWEWINEDTDNVAF